MKINLGKLDKKDWEEIEFEYFDYSDEEKEPKKQSVKKYPIHNKERLRKKRKMRQHNKWGI